MHQVFLGIGGNIGNKHNNLTNVLLLIEKELGAIRKKSSVYETPPWRFQAEENFWNMVVKIETRLNPDELLQKIKTIEEEFGRKPRTEDYSSREMDIDILYFDDLVIENERLKIPHPHIAERLFVTVPLAEIAPEKKHPLLQKTSRKLLESCGDKSEIKKIEL
jgi:2-amino-4-hydroxy-6-hydroxymethyldihydropteridine diphosphokinase